MAGSSEAFETSPSKPTIKCPINLSHGTKQILFHPVGESPILQ